MHSTAIKTRQRARPRSNEGVLRQALDAARGRGATAAEAEIGTGSGLTVTVRNGEVETVEHQADKGLNITVYVGRRKGSAGTTDFCDKALADTVAAACTIAEYASEDPCAGLIDRAFLARSIPDLDLHHPWTLAPEEAIELACECEQHAREADPRVTNSDGTQVSTYSGSHLYGNTHGFAGGWEWSSHTFDCSMIAGSGGGMQRDGWFTRARDHLDLEDARSLGRHAAARTTARLGARRLNTRNAPVIFEAPVAGGLFGAFVSAVSGAALYRKASFLLGRLGTAVFANHVRIHEEPYLKKGMGSAPFDNDGMATQARDLVRDGVLQGYVLSAYSARKLGMAPTGNAGGVHNLIVEHGGKDLSALLKTMDTGLLITDLIGFGVNQVTGDYSRGAAGFWVQGGEIQYPVEEITVAGNLADMYRRIVEIGGDVDRRGNIQTGSVLIERLTIAGE
ncbi:MAG: metalloprotease PmbA [Gammaproteobacteria bacterium]|nr:metalloprotease PmbA [Gammaproteobacteria bacterium]